MKKLPQIRLMFESLLFIAVSIPVLSFGQTSKKEVDIGFASIEEIRPILKQALSPQGKFVMLQGKASILIIDSPQNIQAAEAALAAANLSAPDVFLSAGVQTGLPPQRSNIRIGREVPFPIEYARPTVIVHPDGQYTVVPSSPTKFVKRNIGFTSETQTRVNPDGSVTMDVNTEHTEFEGFINYGSAIFPGGAVGAIPVSGQTSHPQFFSPLFIQGGINVPIVSTTRISTSIIIRPRVSKGIVSIDMMPQLTVEVSEPGVEDVVLNLKQFQTTVDVKNKAVGRVRGFNGASEEFNKEFLGVDPNKEGDVAIVFKVELRKSAEKKDGKEE